MNTNIRLEKQDAIAVVTFDREGSSANIFDSATLRDLHGHLDTLEKDAGLRGVIFTSAKNSIFIAGADINELAGVKSEQELVDTIHLGQQAMNRIAALKPVTVATIHGACLGGGCELALACDYRLASKDKATQIGLPETMLGILPAWGGSTRLPRLIGLPKALDIILGGKKLAAVPAVKCGLVDDIMPREHLMRFALKKTAAGKPHRKSHALTNNALVAGIIAKKAREMSLKKTGGHYPAIPAALDVMANGLRTSIQGSLDLETKAIVALSKTPACRSLIGIFGLQERAKKLGARDVAAMIAAPPKAPNMARLPVSRTAVIGAGIMGAGIAQWISSRSIPVLLRDINAEQVNKGMASIGKLYYEAVKRHIVDEKAARRCMNLVSPCATEVPLKNVDLVIEAAVEKMDLKQKIFQRLGEIAGERTILATNTSALSISEIAAVTRGPERVIGLHFFNPVHRMQLVEIVVGKQTDAAVAERALKFVQQIGRLPVIVKDSPGFVVNRILMPYLVEAGLLFEQGASAHDIDRAMLAFGMPMGPLRLLDEVGIDVAYHVARHLSDKFGARMPMPALLEEMMKAGLLGKKTGKGFFLYQNKHDTQVNPEALKFVKSSGSPPAEPEKRMVLLMVNEAARCLEEQVAAAPEDIDFAMIMGTGFAPFRGGPLRHADSEGLGRVTDALKAFAEKDQRFEPCKLLVSLAGGGGTFYGSR
ncbi:MAG: 3-hydroxyacyl-CoA dehydrogenase NAD-binding domain-containing protein [bacterium]